jgi:hypothetical protein
MYLSFQQVAATSSVKAVAALTVPAKATHAELQATGAEPVRYTMDAAVADPSATSGMILRITDPPKTFLIEDVKRIKFIRGGGSDTAIGIHYFAGRDI